MLRIFLVCVGCVSLFGCVEHPRTEIGIIGYKNIGFEKSIHMTGQYNPETGFLVIENLEVTNDATKAYQAEAHRLDKMYELINTGMVQASQMMQQVLAMYANRPVPVNGNNSNDEKFNRIMDLLERKLQ